MNQHVKLLKKLVREELYVIDDAAVADAVLLRSMTRHTLPEVTSRAARDPSPTCGPSAHTVARGRFG